MQSKFKETKSKKACLGCPFKRVNTNEKPNPGGSHPFVYIGQTRGPFWLPCHQDKNYVGKGSNIETVSQCRGAAIFRSNCGEEYSKPKELLTLPADTKDVFASEAEFVAFYLGGQKDHWEIVLTKDNLDNIMNKAMNLPSKTKRVYK